MRNNIDNILIGVLWLIAATLGTCFWFNIAFGFDIFSGAHWQHLAYMQASQAHVKVSFYISMVIAVFTTIFVLYILIRPRKRHIKLPRPSTAPRVAPQPAPQANVVNQPAPVVHHEPQPVSAVPETAPRPPRLNIPTRTSSNFTAPAQSASAPISAQPAQRDWPELTKIFVDAGYVIKPNPRINGMHIALCAIGTNEELWMGAVGVETTRMAAAIDKLNQVFADTLDDIYINVHGFVVNAPDTATPSDGIMAFDDFNQLAQYMSSHKNQPLPTDEQENFDAYSDYISTVIDYIGKI